MKNVNDAIIHCNSPERYKKLEPHKKEAVLLWISQNIEPRKTICKSAYKLKHHFEYDSDGFYMMSGEFAGAMLKAGFRMKQPEYPAQDRFFLCVE